MVSEPLALLTSAMPVALESAELVGPEQGGGLLLWTSLAGGLGSHATEHWA